MKRLVWHLRKHLFHYGVLVLLLTLLYCRLIEIRWVAITRVQVQMQQLPYAFNGMKVVLLSDLHYPDYLGRAHFQRVVRMINELQPDLVVMTGDLVTGSPEDVESCSRILSDLHAPMGVNAVLGNHDYWSRNSNGLPRAFAEAGITVLRNRSVAVIRGQARLWLVGLDDLSVGATNLEKALSAVPHNEGKILLIDEPDFASYAMKDPSIGLQLSGHSHGGQVRFPVIGGIRYPPLGARYPQGKYHLGSLQLYTNRGIGVLLPFRFNCRPEITMLTLRCAGR